MISLTIINSEIEKIENDLKRLARIEEKRKLLKEELKFKYKLKGALIELYSVKNDIKEKIKKEIEK